MAKTRKVQVTLDEVQYEKLAALARRQDKKLAAVVRESIVRYCLEPEVERRKRDALDRLLALDPAPVPYDYADWEAEYSARKVGESSADPAGTRRSADEAQEDDPEG